MGEYQVLTKTTTKYAIRVNDNDTTTRRVTEIRPADRHEVEVPSFFSLDLFIGASNRILYLYVPDAVGYDTNTYSLPVRKLQEDLKTFRGLVEDWLYSLYITACTSERIAAHVFSFLFRYFSMQQNTRMDFDAVLCVNVTRETILPRLRMDKLERNEEEEEEADDLGNCSICLDRILDDSQNVEAVQISCGHAYHKPCILTWLKSSCSNSCPLCRTPLR